MTFELVFETVVPARFQDASATIFQA